MEDLLQLCSETNQRSSSSCCSCQASPCITYLISDHKSKTSSPAFATRTTSMKLMMMMTTKYGLFCYCTYPCTTHRDPAQVMCTSLVTYIAFGAFSLLRRDSVLSSLFFAFPIRQTLSSTSFRGAEDTLTELLDLTLYSANIISLSDRSSCL